MVVLRTDHKVRCVVCSRVMKLQSWHDGPRVGEEMDYNTILRHLPLKTGDLRSSNTVVQFYRDWLAHPEYVHHDYRSVGNLYQAYCTMA